MSEPLRRIAWPPAAPADPESLVPREWLVTNGLGGYASGTVPGVITRRYHGLLVAALPAPLGRVVMLSHLGESIHTGKVWQALNQLGAQLSSGPLHPAGFRLENSSPIWSYEFEGITIEKQVLLLHAQNTVHITYRLLAGA